MDILNNFEKLPWCKPNWIIPCIDEETNKLLKDCTVLPIKELNDDIQEVIQRSKEFPIPFPVSTIRLDELKERRPAERLKKNTVSTYPLIHERVLVLMTKFLFYKKHFGSSIEKEFYKDMKVHDLIDRILKKRAVTFMGPRDTYKLLSGESGKEGWELVGTAQEKPPLILENCLSYDEMKISSMVYVSGYTECINDGSRHNKGVVNEEGIEDHAVIIGIIGPRFKRKNRMEYEDVVLTEEQNTNLNGYGEIVRENPSAKQMWRKIWAEFYQVESYTYHELKSKVSLQDKPEEARYTDRFVKIPRSKNVFDNEVYYKRISITAECALLEADARAKEEGRDAFLDVIGAGLGVWRATPHQNDVYVLTFLERIWSLLHKNLLDHVSHVNLAYIEPSKDILALFTNTTSSDWDQTQQKLIFFPHQHHPKGGVSVQLESRNPSSKLTGEHEGKLLVMTYAWDGNAHPGNEFWIGKLHSSGDPAAACSTQVSELHNAHINLCVVANDARIVGKAGLVALQDYSIAVLNKTNVIS